MRYIELSRRQKGWSQKQLGDHPRVRIHQSFISLIERGMGLPVPDQITRLSRVLGVAPDLLLAVVPEGTPVPDPSPESPEAEAEGSDPETTEAAARG